MFWKSGVVCAAPQNRRPLFIHAPNRLDSTATTSTSTAASIQISQFSLFSLFMIAQGPGRRPNAGEADYSNRPTRAGAPGRNQSRRLGSKRPRLGEVPYDTCTRRQQPA